MATFLTRTLAEWTASLRYEQLTPDAIDGAKRFLYDSLGCAFGGAHVHDTEIAASYLKEKGGAPRTTVWVDGWKTDPVESAFLNALMIRAMDYNDIYWKQDPSHPSDIIPAATSIAEWKGLSGRDLILGIVLAYEVEMRLSEFAFPGIRERGWHHATLTAYASPLVAGRLLGLNVDQLQHAIGISASRHFTLGAAVAGKLTMMKNTVDPMATRAGVESALLAQLGYTGPENVLDGKEGMFHCLGPEWKPQILVGGLGESFRIKDCGMKSYPTEALTHTPITATLYLLRENQLRAEEIKEVRIETIARAADILSDPAKYDPRTKEAADHSLPYCIAAAMVDHKVTPEQFKQEKIMEPRLRDQLKKIKVLANQEFEALFPKIQACRVEIEMMDGRVLDRRIDVPKGDPRDPMTPEELQIKFDALSHASFSDARRAAIKEAVWKMESYERASDLIATWVRDR
ncbi:MAG: MmgE/PrpD family protein [Candidatus Eisenbacteria bacterium]